LVFGRGVSNRQHLPADERLDKSGLQKGRSKSTQFCQAEVRLGQRRPAPVQRIRPDSGGSPGDLFEPQQLRSCHVCNGPEANAGAPQAKELQA